MVATTSTGQGHELVNVPVRVGSGPGRWRRVADACHVFQWAKVVSHGPQTSTRSLRMGPVLHRAPARRRAADPLHRVGLLVVADRPVIPVQRPFICRLDHRGSIDAARLRRRVPPGHAVEVRRQHKARSAGTGPERVHRHLLPASLHGRSDTPREPDEDLGPSEASEGDDDRVTRHGRSLGHVLALLSGNSYSPSSGSASLRARVPFGPCTDVSTKPFIGSNHGPGPRRGSVFQDAGTVYLLYNPFRANDRAQ